MKKLILFILLFLLFAFVIYAVYLAFFSTGNAKGALQVTSVPESTVYLNDQKIGTTPLCICGTDVQGNQANLSSLFGQNTQENLLPVGEYTIRLVPNDSTYPEFQESITIGRSVLTVVDRKFGEGAESEGSVITLEETGDQSRAELLVLSVPDSATVLLDRQQVGTTPVTLPEVTASDHELLLEKSGYTNKAVRIKTAYGYKLVAKIYLGVNQQAVTGRVDTQEATDSAELKPEGLAVSQVRILSTGTGFLRVRSGPSLANPEIGRVTPGESYPLASEDGEWYQIEFEEGELGWISSQYAQLVEE